MRERGKKKEKGTAKGLGQEPFHQAEERERDVKGVKRKEISQQSRLEKSTAN